MKILSDSTVLIDYARGYPKAKAYLDSLEKVPILTPVVVVMGLVAGCKNKFELNDLTLATGNIKHFEMIGDLKLEKPY